MLKLKLAIEDLRKCFPGLRTRTTENGGGVHCLQHSERPHNRKGDCFQSLPRSVCVGWDTVTGDGGHV